MRALSIFFVTGSLLVSAVLSVPAQPATKVVEKTPKAHPPYSGGVVVIQDNYQSDDDIIYPDDESDSEDDYVVVVEESDHDDSIWYPCTPHDTVQNPSFEGPDEYYLANWTTDNGYALFLGGYPPNAGYFEDGNYNDYALQVYLSGNSPSEGANGIRASIWQYVDVCPSTTYEAIMVFDVDTALIDNGASCQLIFQLGNSNNPSSTSLENFVVGNWEPVFSNAYATAPDETSTLLNITVACGGDAFIAGNYVNTWVDAVHLIPTGDDGANLNALENIPDLASLFPQLVG